MWIAKAGEPPACGVPVKSGALPTISSSGWVDGKTIKEINQSLFDKFKIGDLVADEAVKDKANIIGRELSRIFANNPRLAARIKDTPNCINSIKLVNAKFLRDRVGGEFNQGDKIINLAVKGVRSESTKLRFGGANIDYNFSGVVRHEYGHAVMSSLRSGEVTEGWYTVWESRSANDWSKSISKYASSNSREAFAESFSAYTHPTYGQPGVPRLPTDVESFMKKVVTGL
jgi:hypothetical protein